MAATPVDANSLSLSEGFELSTPISFWVGGTVPNDNPELYLAQIKRLAEAVDARLQGGDANVASSGVVIDTPGWIDGGGFSIDLLVSALQILQVDVALVMGDDRLFSKLNNALKGAQGAEHDNKITVVKLRRSEGVVQRHEAHRHRLRNKRIKEFFYGPTLPPLPAPSASTEDDKTAADGGKGGATPAVLVMPPAVTLSPCRLELKLNQVKLWSYVGNSSGSTAGSLGGLLPVTGESTADKTALERFPASRAADLLHTLMAVFHTTSTSTTTSPSSSIAAAAAVPTKDDEAKESTELQEANVAGFVVVQEVSVARQAISVLAPCPGRLPSHNLVSSNIKWME